MGISSFDLNMQHGRPAWLREDEVVRLDPRSLDLDEDPTGTPYGQIVGFLPVGGVMVVRSHAGAGIFPPEDVTALQGERVDELLLRTLAERAGRPGREPR